MRAVVTGGAGFIGSHVVDALIARGDEVLVIDDFSTGEDANLAAAHEAAADRLHVVRLDIASPEAAMVVTEFSPDIVYHLAAQMNVRRSVAEPLFDAEKNILGTINLLEAVKDTDIQTFILSSTGGAIYGEQDYFPADEEHPVHAECQYGVSKKCAELYLEFYARTHNFCSVALRYANVYGPRQNPKGEAGVVAIFTERALEGKQLTVNGEGKQTRDFVYIADVAAANLKASTLTDVGTFHVFNVGTGVESSVLDIVDSLRTAFRESAHDVPELDVVHGPALPGEQLRSVITAAKISEQLNWEVTVELREGMRKTVDSYSK